MKIFRMIRCLTVAICMVHISIAVAQTKVVFTPQWTAQAQFTGYYVALAKGFYKEAGLDVTIKHPSASKPSIDYLTSGQSQFVTLQLLSAMKEIDKGQQLVNVLQTSQQSGVVIVSHTPIANIQSLHGKKVGHWKVGFSELPMAIDKQYKLDIQWIPFLSHINLYISGAIDASLVMSYNEYIQLEMSGQRIQKNQLLYMKDIGYNIPEDGLYVSEKYYKKNKSTVDKFAEASRRGWEWAIAHPEESLDIVMLTIRQEGVVSNIPIQERMMKACFELLKDNRNGKRSFKLSQQAVNSANRLLVETGIIKKPITYNQITGQ